MGIALPEEIIVLDVDGGEGRESLAGKHLPLTICASTGRGLHYYFHAPKGTARNATSLKPGLDVKTAGGYVVAPPSRHASGAQYQWAEGLEPGEVPIAVCPEWLADLLRRRRIRRHRSTPGLADDGRETIPEGRRNTTLTSYAGRLRSLGMSRKEMLSVLELHNRTYCKPPLPEGEVQAIARSVSGYPAGPVRVDRKIVNADISDGAKLLATLLSAGVPDQEIPAAAGVSERTAARWWKELRETKLEMAARTPGRRHVRVPRGMLLDPELSTGAKATALTLASYMNDGRAQVGQEAMAETRGTRRATISEHIAALEEAGYLVVSREKFCGAKGRRRHVNRYHWPDTEMGHKERFQRQQRGCNDMKRTSSRARQKPYVSPKPFTACGGGVLWGVSCEAVSGTPKAHTKSDGGPKGAVGRIRAPDEAQPVGSNDGLEQLVRMISRDRSLPADYIRRLIDRHGAKLVCHTLECERLLVSLPSTGLWSRSPAE